MKWDILGPAPWRKLSRELRGSPWTFMLTFQNPISDRRKRGMAGAKLGVVLGGPFVCGWPRDSRESRGGAVRRDSILSVFLSQNPVCDYPWFSVVFSEAKKIPAVPIFGHFWSFLVIFGL